MFSLPTHYEWKSRARDQDKAVLLHDPIRGKADEAILRGKHGAYEAVGP